MSKLIKIASGTHQQIISGELHSMLVEWTEINSMNEEAVLTRHGINAGRSPIDVVPTLCYARISLSACYLCSLASEYGSNFDPVEFGKRCEAIAREQIDLHRTVYETAGTA